MHDTVFVIAVGAMTETVRVRHEQCCGEWLGGFHLHHQFRAAWLVDAWILPTKYIYVVCMSQKP